MADAPDIPGDPEQAGLQRSHLDFPVVGLGASAGGLTALQRLLQNMPSSNGMAFVAILHLTAGKESHAAEILQRHTAMPVIQVTEPVPIKPDNVYVIPPSHDLAMDDGWLRLTRPVRVRGPHVAIDLFFRTLAQVHEARAICAVLSGTGTDGAVGLKRVKERGGVTLAQLPDDAEYDGMPRAAIATGMVDFVLPVAEIPQRLLDLWHNAQRIWLPRGAQQDERDPLPPDAAADEAGEQALHDIMSMLRNRTGHDFRHYKRATVLRRIERRLQICEVPDLPAYAQHLRHHADETQALLQDMLISVTNFFRDREAFEQLERDVLPRLYDRRPQGEPVRAWVAGCATGEEAYSMSILLSEYAARVGGHPEPQIFATDIDERALATARLGMYPGSIVTDVAPARLAQYFHKEGNGYRVTKAVRDPVLFAAHNVLRDPPFSRLDLICCRNLLIYMGRDAQANILSMFRFALRPGGFLFLGSSESAEAADEQFAVVDKKHRIYRANSRSPAAVRHMPMPSFTLSKPGMPVLPVAPVRPRDRGTLAELHSQAIERFAPPSVLVDEKLGILHLSPGAGRFLEQAPGVPTLELLPSVRQELRIELRTALFQVAQTGERAEMRDVSFERDGRRTLVRVVVCPVSDPQRGGDLKLVIFQESELPPDRPEALAGQADARLVDQYEQEIEQLKAHLRETVEHSDVSTEELKASNEELQAMIEELRSATEELETSKEELQSMNEELITVNFELKSKVEEAGKVNDDLQNFIAASEVATVFVDSGMRIKRFTPQATSIFNLIATDIGRPLLDITHRLDYGAMQDDIAQVFEQLRIIERRLPSSDGRHFLMRIRPYRTTDDKIAGAVLTFVDVTELRQAEEQVRAGEERLRLAALTTRDYAIFTIDEAGLITTWNEGARRVFGYEESEVLGRHCRRLFTPEDAAAAIPEAEMEQARREGRAEDDRWLRRKDGATFYASGVMTPLDDHNYRGFVKIARDVTGSKRHEAEREALLRREQAAGLAARTANELKDRFLAVMSHELKHPLNLIQVHAELLQRLPESADLPAVRRASESIRGAVRTQGKIIDDLLDLSRARTGKLHLALEPLAIAAPLEAIVTAMQPEAADKGLALEWRCDEPGLVVSCDRARLEQIAWNLLVNAIKFTPPGGRIAASLRREQECAVLEVADTGIGIESGALPYIFGMFSQPQQGRPGTTGGLGIGLALVEELSGAQGGRVSAASGGPDRGATFSVWLPLAADGVVPPPAPVREDALRGMRVLAVDDMEDALMPFAALLRTQGAQVATATTGEAALALLRKQPFDLLVSDIGMGGMDGYALIAAVRALPAGAGLRAVALTGYGQAADVERALQAGYDVHLTKPVDMAQLKAAARAHGS